MLVCLYLFLYLIFEWACIEMSGFGGGFQNTSIIYSAKYFINAFDIFECLMSVSHWQSLPGNSFRA